MYNKEIVTCDFVKGTCMTAIKKVLGILILIIVISVIILVVFRHQIKVAAVRKFVEQWTESLLKGSAIDQAEKDRIKKKLAEFYALVAKKVIPESKVREVWEEEGANPGFWYFYIKNLFTEQIAESGMASLAKEKAVGTVNKFLGYIRDGRATKKELYNLQKEVDIINFAESPLNRMEDEDVENAINRINAVNEDLEKRGPGRPVDPVEKFRELVEKVETVTEKYRPRKEE